MLPDELPAEHPNSDHRNLIGFQRMAKISAMNQELSKLYKEGYYAEADRVLDMMTELRADWEYGAD